MFLFRFELIGAGLLARSIHNLLVRIVTGVLFVYCGALGFGSIRAFETKIIHAVGRILVFLRPRHWYGFMLSRDLPTDVAQQLDPH